MPSLHDLATRALDYVDFPRVLGDLIRDHSDFEGVKFTAAFPKEAAEVPCIVATLVRRVPGMDGVETRKPRYKGEKVNPDGSITEIWTQWMTCIYQFDCIAGSTTEADELLWKLDRFIRNSVGTFLDLGVSEMVFEEQLQDQMLRGTVDFATRSLRWLVRLEHVEEKTYAGIKAVRVNVLYPQLEDYEAIVRADDINKGDKLSRTRISRILYISDEAVDGIARKPDYVPGIDFEAWYDPSNDYTYIQWYEPGKRPDAGDTYYVRYLYWEPFESVRVPYGHTFSNEDI